MLKDCLWCKKPFEFTPKTGRHPGLCSEECRAESNRQKKQAKSASLLKCSVSDCIRKANRVSARMCEACYCYQRRNGTIATVKERKTRVGRYVSSAGYVMLNAPGHPMANIIGLAYEHRVVVFDSLGGVCVPCFWCGVALEWADAVVDHLNEVKDDNQPGNLMVACNRCNRARGSILPFLARMLPERVEVFIAAARAYIAQSREQKAA